MSDVLSYLLVFFWGFAIGAWCMAVYADRLRNQ